MVFQRLKRHTPGMTERLIAHLHCVLFDTMPIVWCRIAFPVDGTLKALHETLQAAIGWQNSHLWEFECGDKRYGIPDPGWGPADAKSIRLSKLLDRGLRHFRYTYDMGDCWQHAITIEAVIPATHGETTPRLTDGAGRWPPEDSGGIPGFERFLAILADPAHPEHASLLDWHGGPFDPTDFDAAATAERVAVLARRRAITKCFKH
jgi:hypothetical protein